MTWKNKHFPSADAMELKAGGRRPSEERPCLLLTGRLSKLKPGRLSSVPVRVVGARRAGSVALPRKKKSVRPEHGNSKGLGSPSCKAGIVLIP